MIKSIVQILIVSIFIPLTIPFIGGTYYAGCGTRFDEQRWLDKAIAYLKVERTLSANAEEREALDYCIKRYNQIGAWDVMIFPLSSPIPSLKAGGANWPFCPGLTLDTEVMCYPINVGAMILFHESQHDVYPYFHPLVDEKMRRLGCL